MKLVVSALACAVGGYGCGGSEHAVVASDTHVTSAPPAALPTSAHPADPAVIAEANNAFGLDLWKQLGLGDKNENKNIALSPASIALAFGMTQAGAAGTTLADLRRVLHLGALDAADVDGAAGALLARWNQGGRPYVLRVANRLFGERTTTFLAPFLDRMRVAYGAPLEPVDFAGAFEPARLHINDWTAGATEQKIKGLIPEGALDTDTRLVLVNAVYFKGQWQTRFDPQYTADGDFKTTDKTVRVPLMHMSAAVRFGQTDGATLLELPYVGGDLAMTFVLPEGQDLATLEASLSPATLARWNAALSKHDKVDVTLPRFKIETASMSLKKALVALGLANAFGPEANFEAMTALKPLFISDAFHKVFVEVNEEGTEAAAATAVVMTKESAVLSPAFVANRPFLFLLRDTRSGHVLFMGRVANPAG